MSKCPSTLRRMAAVLVMAAALPLVAASQPAAPSQHDVHSPSPASSEQGLEFTIPDGTGRVEFDATGWPSALRIHGQGRGLAGTLRVGAGAPSGTISFRLDTLDTGIGLRNRHMTETYLETAKYPSAVLTLTRLDVARLPATESFDVGDVEFEGALELHGLNRLVKGKARIARDHGRIDVEAALELSTTDFGIEVPKFMGITVGEQVKVKVAFSALAQPALARASEGDHAVRHH